MRLTQSLQPTVISVVAATTTALSELVTAAASTGYSRCLDTKEVGPAVCI